MAQATSTQIVALNGSPHRNGNTVTLMGWVMEGCRAAGATMDWIHIVDHQIDYCQGCFTCLRTGACPIQDDVAAVRNRLLAADGIIVGSPVYEGQPTAQLKTFLDRITLLNLYTHTFEHKWSVGVATSGVAPTRGLAKELAMLFGQRSGVIGAKTTSIDRGYQRLADVHSPRLPKRARAVGRKLVQDVLSGSRWRLPRPQDLWIAALRRWVVRPLVTGHPEQFAGVLDIWQAKGWL